MLESKREIVSKVETDDQECLVSEIVWNNTAA